MVRNLYKFDVAKSQQVIRQISCIDNITAGKLDHSRLCLKCDWKLIPVLISRPV